MQRVGEGVSERLDIIPAEFIVHRHVRGKWACSDGLFTIHPTPGRSGGFVISWDFAARLGPLMAYKLRIRMTLMLRDLSEVEVGPNENWATAYERKAGEIRLHRRFGEPLNLFD